MYNRKQRVSPPVKVFVIQQLRSHSRSHMSVFQKNSYISQGNVQYST
jgi:hypothetical protein